MTRRQQPALTHSVRTYIAARPPPDTTVHVLSACQVGTQRSWKRPYGVGLVVAGVDESGPHIFYNCPSGNYYDYRAFAMGARSQVRVDGGGVSCMGWRGFSGEGECGSPREPRGLPRRLSTPPPFTQHLSPQHSVPGRQDVPGADIRKL